LDRLISRLEREISDGFDRLPPRWRPHFEDVELDFDAVDSMARLADDEAIWPQQGQGPLGAHLFKAFWDLEPTELRVVIFGNDPYTRLGQATGRSFEQGDLEDWAGDIRYRRRISPSFQSILAAAVATDEASAAYGLVDRRMAYDDYESENLRTPVWFSHVALARCLADGAVVLPAPQEIFGHWARQGVLWLNRTLTYTRWDEAHRKSHQKLWAPFTRRALEVLVGTAEEHPTVFVLWGSSADDLEGEIAGHAERKALPEGAARIVKTGHPQWPAGYFRVGNPLEQINRALEGAGPAIRWT